MSTPEEQVLIWDYWKPRHTHAWNMFAHAALALTDKTPASEGFAIEYAWENVIIRLWLYRTAVRTLTKLLQIENVAKRIIRDFDQSFDQGGVNGLKALRDMIEHFDDYAAGKGRGPAERDRDLDPPRPLDIDHYQRGHFTLNRLDLIDAADLLRLNAKKASTDFIRWYKTTDDYNGL